MDQYDHKKIEKKWREAWKDSGIFTTMDRAEGKDNFYLLVEFPYPSGNLHVGHWYAFAVPDILARYHRMKGKNVLYPIGFDAFGLPAENAAIKRGLNPRKWTEENIVYMTKQIESMGTSFDWSRKVSTIDPEYYKWTQWMFLQFQKKGLVYQKNTAVNWCPKDKTVLANEQVVDGKCERCDSEVEQKLMLQWNIKITEYADRLIDDLESLDWPEQIKESQKNWIGRSEGAEIDFGLDLGKKYKYVILHGFKGSPDKPRWQWIKSELQKLGHEVIVPALPHTDTPSENEQVQAALEAATYDENTVLVGHSLGSVVALKVLEKLKSPIARLVTIGGFIDPMFKDEKRNFADRFTWVFDGQTIQKNARSITILHDPRDYAVSDAQAAALSSLLRVPLTIGTSTEPHFTGDKEPDVLMWLRPTIRVFTTRPDTLFGATYLVLSPEHSWVGMALQYKTVLQNNDEVQKYIDSAKKKTELERLAEQKEKTGVKLEGVSAINPATGENIPLYVADYVLATYGTGAIMAVPAHDARDHEFAVKFGLPIREVIEPTYEQNTEPGIIKPGLPFDHREAIIAIVKHWSEEKYIALKWKQVAWGTFITGGIEDGQTPEEAAKMELKEEVGYVHAKFIKDFGVVHGKFYHVPKKVNRNAHAHVVYLELEDDERVEITDGEQAIHEVVWLTKDELKKFLTPPTHQHALRWLNGEQQIWTEHGTLSHSGEFDRMESPEAKVRIIEKYGRSKKTFKLRDWIVSRQRYWGVPIPMIHCEKCGTVPVPESDLPVLLPEVEDYLPSGEGKSPLAKVDSFVNVMCPGCKGNAKRETDTLDTFVDSSWYFLRYTDPKNNKQFAENSKQKSWMPVTLYSGGAEHTTMHLLYSRFWHKALFDLGLVDDAEPYKKRMNRSLIMGPDGQKMSKSRGNVIDPDEVVERLGADTVRMYLAFIGPYNEVASYPWNPDGVVGVRRFIERVWRLQESVTEDDVEALVAPLHKTIKKVGDDIEVLKFNTAISQLMIFLNHAEKEKKIGMDQWKTLLKLLEPFAPHIADELWARSGHKDQLLEQKWPTYSHEKIVDKVVTIAVQINGKTRATVDVVSGADKQELEDKAHSAVASRILGKKIEKTIVVPGRLVNFVLEE